MKFAGIVTGWKRVNIEMSDLERILIVDDDRSARRILSMVLSKKGFETDLAATGQEALEKAEQTDFNVALLDMRLPDTEGVDLLTPLQKLQPDLIMFIVTGHASLETAVEAVNRGAAGYITKPVDMEDMLSKLQGALERQRLIGENRRLLEQVQAELEERKLVEKAVEASETRYRLLVENAPLGILSINENGDILTVNDKLIEILGSPSREATKSLNVLTLPGMVEAGISTDFQTCLDEKKLIVNEKAYTTYWEKRVDLRYHLFPILDLDGGIISLQAIVEDITERKQAEEDRIILLQQIQRQAEQMQQTINVVPDGVLVLGAGNRIVQANPIADRLLKTLASVQFGDAVTHLAGRPLSEFLVPPKNRHWHEITTDLPDRHFYEVAARPVDLDTEVGQGWVIVLRDVTRQREIQERTQQQQQLATVGQLAAGIAHDFNNLLAVIVLYTQLALNTPDLSLKLRERLITISDQAQRASDLIQQILDFSRRAVLERHPLNLRPFLKEQVKLLQRTLPENVRIHMSYGEGEHLINADPTRIQQALLNLAINARDAMPHGGDLRIQLHRLTLSKRRELPLPEMEPGEWVELVVSDTGTGIHDDAMPHIFEPFFTTKEVGKGSGLGLAQVYGIVRQHEGFVDVKTKIGEGTTFVFYLPALPASESDYQSNVLGPMTKGDGELILVVEDDPVLRTAVAASVQNLNYRVVEASNGREALSLFEEYSDDIALVLSDVIMPEMGGKELLKALRQKRPSLKTIVMTGHLLSEEIETLKAHGMVTWLQKPLRLEDLSNAIAQALPNSIN